MNIKTDHSEDEILAFSRFHSLGRWCSEVELHDEGIGSFCHIWWIFEEDLDNALGMATQFAYYTNWVEGDPDEVQVHMFESPDASHEWFGFFTKNGESSVLAIQQMMAKFAEHSFRPMYRIT